MEDRGIVAARMAIEALRSGIPNRPAIGALSLGVADIPRLKRIVSTFRSRLEESGKGLEEGRAVEGLIVAGGFGSGKSHLLGIFREMALRSRFVVSIVPIGKETQLFHPGRLFAAAVHAAEVPDLSDETNQAEPVNDEAVIALIRGLKGEQEGYDNLFAWLQEPSSQMAPVFSALLYLLSNPHFGWERISEIASFFGGGRLTSRMVRDWLRDVGQASRFDTRLPRVAELDRQRARFFPRLCKAAGYRGWCLFLDELELLGRYSIKQRARSYCELARWLALEGDGVPGCLTVGAITDDFADAILIGRNDREEAPRTSGPETEDGKRARAAIEFITRETSRNRLAPPPEEELHHCLAKVVELYEKAYGWRSTVTIGDRRVGKTLREYIKGWIAQLDVARLYGERTDLIYEPPILPATEDEVFSSAPDPSDGEPAS